MKKPHGMPAASRKTENGRQHGTTAQRSLLQLQG